MDDLMESLLQVIRRLSAEAAYESLYGEEIPESQASEMLARPIAFDPRFDLVGAAEYVIDDMTLNMRRMGHDTDLRQAVVAAGLGDALEAADTVSDYLAVVRRAVEGRRS